MATMSRNPGADRNGALFLAEEYDYQKDWELDNQQTSNKHAYMILSSCIRAHKVDKIKGEWEFNWRCQLVLSK